MKGIFPRFYLFLPLLIAALIYFVSIMREDIWHPDEARYAEVAREMIENGNYIQPYFNGKPYTEKPPLFFWMVAAGAQLFGDVNAFSVRLPSVLSAIGIIALLIIFVNEFFDRKVAFLSAIFLCTSSGEFYQLAKAGRIDMLFTLLITAALVSFYRWYARDRCGYLIIFYTCLTLATLAKGPVGIALPIMVALCFLSARKEWVRIKGMYLYIGLPFALAVVLAWYIPATQQSTGYDFLPMVNRQIINRVIGHGDHNVSLLYWPFYHFKSVGYGIPPWSFLMPWAIVYAYKVRRDAPSFLLLCWAGSVFVFFTLIGSKREVYILPMYPAAATLIALWVMRSTTAFSLKLVQILSFSWGIFLLILVAVAPIYLKHKYPDLAYHIGWNVLAPSAVAGVVAVATAVLCKKLKFIIGGLIGAILVTFAIIITTLLPMENEYKSPRYICDLYNKIKTPDSEIAMFGGVREGYVFYTKSFIKPLQNSEELKQFFNSNKRTFCFVKLKDYGRFTDSPDFPVYVVAKEGIGSRVMMLLCNQKVPSPPVTAMF